MKQKVAIISHFIDPSMKKMTERTVNSEDWRGSFLENNRLLYNELVAFATDVDPNLEDSPIPLYMRYLSDDDYFDSFQREVDHVFDENQSDPQKLGEALLPWYAAAYHHMRKKPAEAQRYLELAESQTTDPVTPIQGLLPRSLTGYEVWVDTYGSTTGSESGKANVKLRGNKLHIRFEGEKPRVIPMGDVATVDIIPEKLGGLHFRIEGNVSFSMDMIFSTESKVTTLRNVDLAGFYNDFRKQWKSSVFGRPPLLLNMVDILEAKSGGLNSRILPVNVYIGNWKDGETFFYVVDRVSLRMIDVIPHVTLENLELIWVSDEMKTLSEAKLDDWEKRTEIGFQVPGPSHLFQGLTAQFKKYAKPHRLFYTPRVHGGGRRLFTGTPSTVIPLLKRESIGDSRDTPLCLS